MRDAEISYELRPVDPDEELSAPSLGVFVAPRDLEYAGLVVAGVMTDTEQSSIPTPRSPDEAAELFFDGPPRPVAGRLLAIPFAGIALIGIVSGVLLTTGDGWDSIATGLLWLPWGCGFAWMAYGMWKSDV